MADETEHFKALAAQDASDAGFPPDVFVAQINAESGFNPHAQSGAGAEGIAQFEPATAAGLGVDPWNPEQALQGAAQLMASYLHQFGSIELALAAYNAGPGAVQQYGGVPPFAETQRYVANIMAAAGSVAIPAQVAAAPADGSPVTANVVAQATSWLVPAAVVLAALWVADVI